MQGVISDAFAAARVARENALVTGTAAPLLEPSSDIPPLTMLGDILFAAGDIVGAREAYARAVDVFAEEDEPVDRIVDLAQAAAAVPAAPDWRPSQNDRFLLLDCLRRTGPSDWQTVAAFARGRSGAAVEAQIARSLANER